MVYFSDLPPLMLFLHVESETRSQKAIHQKKKIRKKEGGNNQTYYVCASVCCLYQPPYHEGGSRGVPTRPHGTSVTYHDVGWRLTPTSIIVAPAF